MFLICNLTCHVTKEPCDLIREPLKVSQFPARFGGHVNGDIMVLICHVRKTTGWCHATMARSEKRSFKFGGNRHCGSGEKNIFNFSRQDHVTHEPRVFIDMRLLR